MGHGILHLAEVRGLMMDETGDYACGNHHARCAPFETLVYTCAYSAYGCAKAMRVCVYSHAEYNKRARERDRACTVLSRGIASREKDDGDEFLEGCSPLR